MTILHLPKIQHPQDRILLLSVSVHVMVLRSAQGVLLLKSVVVKMLRKTTINDIPKSLFVQDWRLLELLYNGLKTPIDCVELATCFQLVLFEFRPQSCNNFQLQCIPECTQACQELLECFTLQ
jgi:hypothetical protein